MDSWEAKSRIFSPFIYSCNREARPAAAAAPRGTNPFRSGATNQLFEDDDLIFEEFARIRMMGHEGEETTQELGEPAGDADA